jgi:hypothetical protein
MMKILPETREEELIAWFLNGLYSAKQRHECQRWLEISGSTWSNLASFGLTNTPAGPARIRSGGKKEQQTQPRQANDKRPRSTSLKKATTKANEKRSRPTLANKVTTKSELRKDTQDQVRITIQAAEREGPRRSQRLQESNTQLDHGALKRPQKVLGRRAGPHAADPGLSPVRPESQANTTSLRRKEAGPRSSNSKPRDIKGRFISATRTRPAASAVSARRGPGHPAKALNDEAPTKPPQIKKSRVVGAHIRGNQQAPHTPTKPASARPLRLPSTPISQITSAPTGSPVPRVTKRKRSSKRDSRDQRKKQRLMDEPELPQLPGKDSLDGKAPRGLRRRLPLPQPPQIPIMPTSD